MSRRTESVAHFCQFLSACSQKLPLFAVCLLGQAGLIALQPDPSWSHDFVPIHPGHRPVRTHALKSVTMRDTQTMTHNNSIVTSNQCNLCHTIASLSNQKDTSPRRQRRQRPDHQIHARVCFFVPLSSTRFRTLSRETSTLSLMTQRLAARAGPFSKGQSKLQFFL